MNDPFSSRKSAKPGARAKGPSRFLFFSGAILPLIALSCSVLATRPVQEMSDTQAAIKAAREVQADTLAPELYRQSTEWFFKAKSEYKLKNFANAKTYSAKARKFAEQAEFEAIRNGASRVDVDAPAEPEAQASPPPAQVYGQPESQP